MYIWNHPKSRMPPQRQGKLISKIPMKMIFIDEMGQAFEYLDGHFIYKFCVYIERDASTLKNTSTLQ